jgi:CDP-paratose 2-epimerase
VSRNQRILVTGSSGLIGSEVAGHFDALGWDVHGVDNNQRAVFFGPAGDTRWNQERLAAALENFHHHEVDIRDRPGVLALTCRAGSTEIVVRQDAGAGIRQDAAA